MAEPFLGEIKMVPWAWTRPQRSWAFCDGSLLPITQNQALFAVLGTAWGGDGQRTFGLPDLRARTVMGASPQALPGTTQGAPSHLLQQKEVALHTHQLQAVNADGTQGGLAGGDFLGSFNNGYGANPGPGPNQTTLAATTLTTSSGNVPHENRQPFLTINFAIALSGIFPSRN